MRPRWKKWLHIVIAVAIVLHLFSCIFLGESHLPGEQAAAPRAGG